MLAIYPYPLPPPPSVRIATVPIPPRIRVKVRSYLFVPPTSDGKNTDENSTDVQQTVLSSAENISENNENTEKSEHPSDLDDFSLTGPQKEYTGEYTRIKIPRDAIRIEDRLQLLLQPPLEIILQDKTLELPFEPFPYQKQGIAYLMSAHFAVLADEMGLGKTMQAITAVRLLLRTGELKKVLFVCPKPLVTNWKREFDLWAPELHVQIIEGNQARRKHLWQHPDIPIRIANYELLSRDQPFYDAPRSMGGILFDLVVLDESQRIKNKSSNTASAARAIPRRRNWAMTGTPVENSVEDIVGIFEFLSPGFVQSEMRPSQIGERVGEHILRRTKDLVMTDIPPKMIRDAQIELTPQQWESYQAVETAGVGKLTELGDNMTLQNVFELVMRLKQICNFDPETGESSKLERMMADIEEVAESGRKSIVFSQWVQTLYKLRGPLAKFGPLEYHGKIPSSKRDAVIQQFREDPKCNVILMSYGAGSVGLNLQFASYVFLFDRWWNPAVEDQAINRAHRIGASGPVTVTRFVSINTIEERIDRILQEKRNLSEQILSGAQGLNVSSGLNHEDIFGLFNLHLPSPKRLKSA